MRIAEEIDATEAMGLQPIPFVVGTRLVGGLLCVIPGYALALLTSFFVSKVMIRGFYHATGGTYDHYFIQFLSQIDLVYSAMKPVGFWPPVIIPSGAGHVASPPRVSTPRMSARASPPGRR